MVFPNKPDEDWYWPVEILHTSAFFMLLYHAVFAEVFLTLILFLIDSVHFGDVNPRGVLSYINLIDIALKSGP